MALSTFAELKTAIASLLNRGDLTSSIPDFITLAESEMRRILHTRRVIGRSTATLTSQYIAMPTDFGGPRSVVLASTDPKSQLRYVSPEKALELQEGAYTGTGQPRVYSVVGDELQFLPAPDGSYDLEMTYWRRLAALSDSATSNWMLTDHPDAYLYGSAKHSAPYLKDDQRIVVWGGLFESAMQHIEREDSQASFGGRLNMMARSFG